MLKMYAYGIFLCLSIGILLCQILTFAFSTFINENNFSGVFNFKIVILFHGYYAVSNCILV